MASVPAAKMAVESADQAAVPVPMPSNAAFQYVFAAFQAPAGVAPPAPAVAPLRSSNGRKPLQA